MDIADGMGWRLPNPGRNQRTSLSRQGWGPRCRAARAAPASVPPAASASYGVPWPAGLHPTPRLVPVRDETDAYSPAAIDTAPANSPAVPAMMVVPGPGSTAATPTTRDEIDTTPSFAPSTATLSHPLLVPQCGSPGCAVVPVIRSSDLDGTFEVSGSDGVLPPDQMLPGCDAIW